MTVLMRPKAKYRRGFRSTNKGGENAAPKKKRTKVGQRAHNARFGEPPVIRKVVDGRTGKSRWVRD